jgi:polar amino acid transport system substrate-binding protein
MRFKLIVPALVAATALALTGCSNNGGGGNTTTPAPTIAPDAASIALLPADIKTAGELTMGVDATYPPNEYKDAAGNPIGWDIELANAVAAKLGLKPVWSVAAFANIIPSVTGNKVSMGVSSFTDNTERQKQVNFVDYYQAGILWASAAGKTVNPDDACGLKVAVQATTYEHTDEVPAKSKACVDAGKPAINIVPFDTQDAATTAVALGQVDAMSADSPVTAYAIAQSKGKLQAAGSSFDVAPYGYALSKTLGLDKAIQTAVQSLMDDGTYLSILTKYGVQEGAIKTATINGAK